MKCMFLLGKTCLPLFTSTALAISRQPTKAVAANIALLFSPKALFANSMNLQWYDGYVWLNCLVLFQQMFYMRERHNGNKIKLMGEEFNYKVTQGWWCVNSKDKFIVLLNRIQLLVCLVKFLSISNSVHWTIEQQWQK